MSKSFRIWLSFTILLGSLWSSSSLGNAAPIVPEGSGPNADSGPSQQLPCDTSKWRAQRYDLSDTQAHRDGSEPTGLLYHCTDSAALSSGHGQADSIDWSTLYTSIHCRDAAVCIQPISGLIDDDDATGIYSKASLERLKPNSERFEAHAGKSAASLLDRNTGNSLRLQSKQRFVPQMFDESRVDEAAGRSGRRLWGKILNIGLLLIFLEKYLWRS